MQPEFIAKGKSRVVIYLCKRVLREANVERAKI